MTTKDSPEPPQFINTVEIVSSESSKIEKVSLYSGRAEIKRSYTVDLKTGQNQVKISGLPTVLDNDSLRVEGRGSSTIQGVTVTSTEAPPLAVTSEVLESLFKSQDVTEKAIARCKKAITSLESYLSSAQTNTIGGENVWQLFDSYESQGENLDKRLLKLEAELQQLVKDIDKEQRRLGTDKPDDRLTKTLSIDLFADVEGPVTIVLIYAVSQASWNAIYDIRVRMDAIEDPVKLVYKASVTQSTGESWDDISLTLETVTPTFGVALPTLNPWKISPYTAPPLGFYGASKKRTRSVFGSLAVDVRRAAAPHPYDETSDDESKIAHRQAVISGQGNLSTSFLVPGLVSIPNGSDARTFTIVELNLGATMHYLTLPRASAKVHLKAKIKNASEYPILPGSASVYVDGSFVSKTAVPASSPQETFDCALGPDPSIRVTYHPLSKKASESGFYSKMSSRSYTQLITIHNTKTTPINDLTVVDHIPVPEDAQISVKLLNPPLTLPTSSALKASSSKGDPPPPPVNVAKGVIAQWDGTDDPDTDTRSLGSDGRIAWKCAVPQQGKLNITLMWEVNAPSNMRITGL